jgi:uncharacterized Fe-S cluster-containing protein
MTEAQIIAALANRFPLPTVSGVISEFHCGYQKAKRCLEAAEAALKNRTFTLEDF